VEVSSRSLRIGVFSYRLPVAGERRGGIEKVAHVLADGLARRGHSVTVWTHDPKPQGALYDVRALPWRRFVDTWLGRRATMGYLGNLLAVMPSYRESEVVIAHGDSLLLPLLRKPVVRIMHGSAMGEALSSTNPLRFLAQIAIYGQELASAISNTVCVGVSENSRRMNPFISSVIPNGVDSNVFKVDPRGKKAETPMILFVGTAEGRKRGRILIEMFARQVRPRIPTATLHFVGPLSDPSPGVIYHEGLEEEELAALYRQAWLYASPSSYEGFGLPYVEAMACGTPVLAVPNPGSEEVLEGGKYGRLVELEDFGKAMLELIADAQGRQRLAEAGLQRARIYTDTRMIDAYEVLLRKVCQGAASR